MLGGDNRQILGASQSSQNGKQAPGSVRDRDSEAKIESNWKTLDIDVWSPYKVQEIQTTVLYRHSLNYSLALPVGDTTVIICR